MDNPLVQNQDDTADHLETARDDRVVLTEEDVCNSCYFSLLVKVAKRLTQNSEQTHPAQNRPRHPRPSRMGLLFADT